MYRSPQEVADAHLDAVTAGDPVAMAADYASDAVLERLGETYHGHTAIAEYFATVPQRLGDARVVFDSMTVDGDEVTFAWRLDGAPTATSGTDVCRIVGGMIVHQVVHLNATDF